MFLHCSLQSKIRPSNSKHTLWILVTGNLDGDSASPFPRFLTQQAVFFGFYIEYSRSVMVSITRKDKTWQVKMPITGRNLGTHYDKERRIAETEKNRPRTVSILSRLSERIKYCNNPEVCC